MEEFIGALSLFITHFNRLHRNSGTCFIRNLFSVLQRRYKMIFLLQRDMLKESTFQHFSNYYLNRKLTSSIICRPVHNFHRFPVYKYEYLYVLCFLYRLKVLWNWKYSGLLTEGLFCPIEICVFKQRTREADPFHGLLLASAWGRTVDFNALFLIYTCHEAFVSYSHVAYGPLTYERNYPESSVNKYQY